MLTHGIPPDFCGGVDLFIQPYAIEPVSSLSAQAIGYDGVHCREPAGTGPVVFKVHSLDLPIMYKHIVTSDEMKKMQEVHRRSAALTPTVRSPGVL